jgi:hypothetical protein
MAESLHAEEPRPVGGGCLQPRLWAWFSVGFLVVFVAMAMLLCVKMGVMNPSGVAVVDCPLWRYYVIEFRKELSPTVFGPGSHSGSAVIETLLFHVLLSAFGGGLVLGARLFASRKRKA